MKTENKTKENACFKNVESNREKLKQAYDRYPGPYRHETDLKKELRDEFMLGFENGYNYADSIFPKGTVPDKKSEYKIESSRDGIKWRYEGGFSDGDPSRFGMEMRPELAVKEAESFRAYYLNDESRKYIRLIVDIL